MRIITALFLFFTLPQIPTAQGTHGVPAIRSALSVMVIPFAPGGDKNVKNLIEHDTAFRQAISYINSALIDMGYSKTLDFLTFKDIIDKKISITEDEVWSTRAKRYIEQAPVDIIIETDLTWIDPRDRPHDRQAIVQLKAVDKYTSVIYANASSIRTAPREFPGLPAAMDCALNRDGRVAFQNFLAQLDSSCAKLPKKGRITTIKFEIATESTISLYDAVGNERLLDKIKAFVSSKAFHGGYEIVGFSAKYMELQVQLPVFSDSSSAKAVNADFDKELNNYLNQWGIKTDCTAVGSWLNFILQRRDN